MPSTFYVFSISLITIFLWLLILDQLVCINWIQINFWNLINTFLWRCISSFFIGSTTLSPCCSTLPLSFSISSIVACVFTLTGLICIISFIIWLCLILFHVILLICNLFINLLFFVFLWFFLQSLFYFWHNCVLVRIISRIFSSI